MSYNSAEYARKYAHEQIDKMFAKVQAVRTEVATLKRDMGGGGRVEMLQNEADAKRNQQLAETAVAYLKALGVPDTYRKAAMDGIKKWEEELKQAEEKQRRLRESEEKKSLVLKLAASMAASYGLPVTATSDEVFEAVLSADKYLNLAYWLQRNRNDWSDGPTYADIGLRSFGTGLETDQDKEVFDAIQGLVTNWDGDGRCFQDCKWNYGRLFSLAKERNPKAAADYETLYEARGVDY
jgi:hypothetical protein